jgi:hypothetical protein
MTIRDRIIELRRVRAAMLKPHPLNWRTHPPGQRAALAAVLTEIGYAGALLARELDDGSLELIDGHLRAETTPDDVVPVLIVDLSADEARTLLAAFDPLSALARPDPARLQELLANVQPSEPALAALLDTLRERPAIERENKDEAALAEAFQVVVECADENQQQALYERLSSEGLRCRIVTM